MQISHMHAQLEELSREYERISKIGVKLRAVSDEISNTQAHLANLKHNVESQIEVFDNIAPVKEDTRL